LLQLGRTFDLRDQFFRQAERAGVFRRFVEACRDPDDRTRGCL
tara:strand:+ start:8175 stop:8303 length:129 start_codon:yes stop_codon:yes gene_type:complete